MQSSSLALLSQTKDSSHCLPLSNYGQREKYMVTILHGLRIGLGIPRPFPNVQTLAGTRPTLSAYQRPHTSLSLRTFTST